MWSAPCIDVHVNLTISSVNKLKNNMALLSFFPSFTFLSVTFLFNLFCISSLYQRVVLLNFLDIKVNPNSLLFSKRKRERESSKSSREGDGAMVLGKFSVPGRPTNLENSWAMDYCACSRCGRGVV